MTFIPFNLNRFTPSFVNYKKGCTRFAVAVAIDKVYQLLARVCGSLRVLQLPPSLKLVATI
jgi:hypothetical protein